MARPKKQHGGPREHAGRPPIDPELKKERVVLYLNRKEEVRVREVIEEMRREDEASSTLS